MKGHIRERSPGHWAIVIDGQDANGARKRRWHSLVGSKRDAQARCAELVAEAAEPGDPWLDITKGLSGIYALCLGDRYLYHHFDVM
jgi:hypothetical protein